MVSKSNVLGKSPIILVTVGSTPFQFDRLFSTLDSTLANSQLNPLLIVQQGTSQYRWKYKNVLMQKYLKPDDLLRFIKTSDKIVTHSGPATIHLVVKYAKFLPLVVPRLAKFKEHIDNHQLLFSKFLRNKVPSHIQRFFLTQDILESKLNRYINERSSRNVLKKYLFFAENKKKFLHKLNHFIDTGIV